MYWIGDVVKLLLTHYHINTYIQCNAISAPYAITLGRNIPKDFFCLISSIIKTCDNPVVILYIMLIV
jgi:hypothetical protein